VLYIYIVYDFIENYPDAPILHARCWFMLERCSNNRCDMATIDPWEGNHFGVCQTKNPNERLLLWPKGDNLLLYVYKEATSSQLSSYGFKVIIFRVLYYKIILCWQQCLHLRLTWVSNIKRKSLKTSFWTAEQGHQVSYYLYIHVQHRLIIHR
jgi:hypothetical protein